MGIIHIMTLQVYKGSLQKTSLFKKILNITKPILKKKIHRNRIQILNLIKKSNDLNYPLRDNLVNIYLFYFECACLSCTVVS